MRSKPLIFNIYALLFLAIAISIPVQISMIYGHNVAELGPIYSKMTIFNILVIGVSLYNFYYCFTASDNVKWSFPLAIGVICFNNSIVLVYGNDFESYSVILATILFMVMSAYFLLTHDTDVMNHPENQWWRIPRRFSLKEKVTLHHLGRDIDMGETFDISTSGAFIPYHLSDSYNIFKGDEIIDFSIGAESPIHCRAKIVRKSCAKGLYPDGIGIQFIEMNSSDKLKLQQKLFSSRMATLM
jgi:hypothetical protein